METALSLAKEYHAGQTRKYTGEPYLVHCMSVAGLVAAVTDNTCVIEAAILHDTLEDTSLTKEEIAREVGSYTLSLVEEVTDIATASDGFRKDRKEIERIHLSKASPLGQTIKLADIIDNVRSIGMFDKKFAKVYLKEKEELLKVLTKGSISLHHIASNMVRINKERIGGGT